MIMKKTGFLLVAIILLSGTLFTGSTLAREIEPVQPIAFTPSVQVYYFHLTRRCATCLAVESVTEAAIKENFADAMAKGSITFQSVNLEEKANKSLVKKMKVSGQALLVVSGDERIDITDKGFLYARNEPDRLKTVVKETVEKMTHKK